MGTNLAQHVREDHQAWLQSQKRIVEELVLALRSAGDDDKARLKQAIDKAVHHTRRYYEFQTTDFLHNQAVESECANRAFMWLGKARPSMEFQLLYALMGHKVEEELEQLLRQAVAVDDGKATSLAALSALQLTQLNDLHTETLKEEDRIDFEIAKLQQTLAEVIYPKGLPLPSTNKILTAHEVATASSTHAADSGIALHGNLQNLVREKLDAMRELSSQADRLRLKTFDQLVGVLKSPYQKAQYLLAAAKLHIALRVACISFGTTRVCVGSQN
ncbi:hypothetical protein KP509_32G013200 [Ceratopteris richardii]|uniref:DOG1 domain-containing protein n=2 Tax=Ceratopteris richardii TaxID=49495 RepID=A0A8T2QTA7_CERRI|nr:hypothetical protein KP509_32G013200 [Ceratopteris richardii]